jgi:hypothetical protein
MLRSQLVKTTEAGAARIRRWQDDQGRKRHVVTDTLGNMLGGLASGADVRDRDGAPA